ncbi:MAG TPA: hypothetical protein VF590_23605 [Isosphaeraceae bacterium]
MPGPIDGELLRGYLAETLPAGEMARVEKALRDSAELRALLEDVRQDRGDAGLHSLGAFWRRGRLSCPTRQTWGSYLLEALDPALADYLSFHLEVVDCPFCRANLADLEGRTASRGTPAAKTRQSRIFQSSRHLLPGDS